MAVRTPKGKRKHSNDSQAALSHAAQKSEEEEAVSQAVDAQDNPGFEQALLKRKTKRRKGFKKLAKTQREKSEISANGREEQDHDEDVGKFSKKDAKRGGAGQVKALVSRKAKHKANNGKLESKLPAEMQKTLPIVIQPNENGPLRGMRKWLADYHSKRPGFHVLQQRIDKFVADFEATEEKERKEREAAAAEEGWTVVEHHKGRKKTADLESGIKVGGVALAAAERNLKKGKKDIALNFYRFQRREARRNEVLELQQRFEEDKKKIAALRAARKFRPY